MCDIETIDGEPRLVARAWRVAREMSGYAPSTVHIDELLDERAAGGVGKRSCVRGLTGSTPRCWPVTISSACTVTIRRAYEAEGGRFVIRVRLKEQTGHREDVELPAVPRVGDFIHRPSGPELKVVSVHWSVDPEVSADVVLLVVPSTTLDYR